MFENQRLSPRVERFIQILIIYSVATYFIEVEWLRTDNSRQGNSFFLWSERLVAIIFTGEYLWRWIKSKDPRYPLTAAAIIDLISILPFWIGFWVDTRWLRIIRALRILRLIKFYRHNCHMQVLVEGLYRAWPQLKALGSVMGIVVLLSTALIFEMERVAQPDKFKSLHDGFWWTMVTITTIGYGDLYPVTMAGKNLAVGLMVIGLGLAGAFIGIVGNAFFQKKEEG